MPMRPPNVVMIVLDSVRRDHLSCYGHTRPTTPNIDRIAGAATLYRRAYAASCWTIPSHASLFTGLYPSRHRADVDTKHLDAGHATIAGYLRAHGYATAAISCNGFVSRHTNLTSGFEVSEDVGHLYGGVQNRWGRTMRGLHRRWRDATARDRGARSATRRAQRWLRRQGKERPFFLFLNYMDCHLPYGLRGAPRYRFLPPQERARADRVPQDPFAYMAGATTLSRQDLDDLQKLYDAALHHLDAQVGALDAALADLGLADDTLLVITSDHGESFGEHGLLDHQYALHEPLIAVPLVIRFPRGVQRPGEQDALVQHVDLFPTIAGLLARAGVNGTAPATSGRSLLDANPRDAVVAEYRVPNLLAFRRRFPRADVERYNVALRSVSDGRYKLVEREDGRAELFDLATDPAEEKDLAGIRVDIVGRLRERLATELGAWAPAAAEWRDDTGLAEVRERLEALGYL